VSGEKGYSNNGEVVGKTATGSLAKDLTLEDAFSVRGLEVAGVDAYRGREKEFIVLSCSPGEYSIDDYRRALEDREAISTGLTRCGVACGVV
jgi:hypothetical protein